MQSNSDKAALRVFAIRSAPWQVRARDTFIRHVPDPGRLRASSNHGLLRVELTPEYNLKIAGKNPNIPILAVGDRPVSVGFGTTEILLEPGHHVIQAQDGNGVASWPVQVEPETETSLACGISGTDAPWLGPSDHAQWAPVLASRTARTVSSVFVGMFFALVLYCPLALLSAHLLDNELPQIYQATYFLCAITAGALAWHKYESWDASRLGKPRRVTFPSLVEPPQKNLGSHDPRILLHDVPDSPGIIIDFQLIRSFIGIGASRTMWSIWTPSPVVRLNGRSIGAAWGRWFIPCSSGTITLDVSVTPPGSPQVDSDRRESISISKSLTVTTEPAHVDYQLGLVYGLAPEANSVTWKAINPQLQLRTTEE